MSASWVRRALAASAELPRAARLVALLLAGLSGAFLVEAAAHAVLPASTERGVVVHSIDDAGPRSYEDGPGPPPAALLDAGQAVDLSARNELGVSGAVRVGIPVLVTRSHADGQVLAVRPPEGYVDTFNYPGAWVLRVFAAVGLMGGLAVGLSNRRRDRWWAVAALVVSAGIASAWLWTGPELARTEPPSDGMWIFDREPLPRVAALGEPVRVQEVTVTVLGAPTPGLPPGADPALAGFETLTVPLHTRAEKAGYVPMRLIGDGAGLAVLLLGYPGPACGGAPGALGDEVPAGTAELALCAVVPTGFEPRYLVVGGAGPEETALLLR